MASKKKESEAFNLLKFMYQDDDDDMEEADKEDDDEEEQQQQQQQDDSYKNYEREPEEIEPEIKDEDMNPNDDVYLPNHNNANVAAAPRVVTTNRQLSSANSTPRWSNMRPPTPQMPPQISVSERREKPTIVDYGHDDAAMSPEPEEGEILGSSAGHVVFGDDLGGANDVPGRTPTSGVTPNNQVDSPRPSARVDISMADGINGATNVLEAEAMKDANITNDDAEKGDPLDKFLPPPPTDNCSDELQEKINKFLAYKRQGKIFNVEVRNRKDYRNPDFLRHAVRYQEIDEIGSCFSKDVFDPHGYDKSDYYDAIEADMKREMERKEQERKKSQKVDFVSGGTQAGLSAAAAAVAAAQKVILPSSSVPNLPSGGLQSGSTDVLTREGRQNKKSKWDKVDGDRRNPLGGGQDTSAVGAHAALLSAANAGAGYAIFAQQKRREAEEKRSSDKKVDRRS